MTPEEIRKWGDDADASLRRLGRACELLHALADVVEAGNKWWHGDMADIGPLEQALARLEALKP